MDSPTHHLFRVLAALWLGAAIACATDRADRGRLLVELEAADFVTGASYWPQHLSDCGLPGHFIPRGSPTQQLVAGAPAVVFDGDGDAFVGPITTAALHAPGASHSVEIWAFQGTIRDQEALVSWGKRGGPDASLIGFRYGSDPEFGAVGLWASVESGFTTLPRPGQWHHLAFTYDGKRQAIYVDGQLDTSKNVGQLDAHDTLPILLGAEWASNRQMEGKFTHFSGALGRVRIFSGALEPAAIQRHFEQESPQFPGRSASPLVRAPLHRFSFSEPTGPAPDGTQVADSIGGLTAVVRGANAQFTGNGVRLPGGASATEAYLDFPNRMISAHEDVTIELWVTQETAMDWCRILSIGTNRAGEIPGPGGTFVGSETLTLFGNVGAAPINRFARSEGSLLNGGPDRDPADYPDSELGTQFHQVILYQKALAEWRWYRNGVLMEVIPDAEGPLTLDDVNVWLGRSEFSNDNNFRGTYHELRVYNRALGEGEIVGNCQAGATRLNLSAPPKLAQWTRTHPGRHSFDDPTHWSDAPPPNGSAATATIAKAVSGDQTIELGTTTLGALNLGTSNGGGTFTLVAQQDGGLTLDAGVAGPSAITQLPGSLPNRLDLPITLASATEIANLAYTPLIVSGPLNGPGPLKKTAPGPLVITSDDGDFHGEVSILTGSLVLGNGGNTGSLAASRFALAADGTLAVNRRDDWAFAPTVDGSGRFLHEGPGSLTLGEGTNLTTTGFVDADDGAGQLISEGRIEGAAALRTDTTLVLAAHSSTRVREYLGVGFFNGGHLIIGDGASVNLSGGEGALNVGDAGSGQSLLEMKGGTVFWKELYVGKNLGTSGVLLQTGGDLTKRDRSGGDARIGGAFGDCHGVWGACRLSGGTFTTDSNLHVGAFGLGVLEIDGGSAAIRGFLSIGRFRDGNQQPSYGVVDVAMGRLATTAPDSLLLVGEEGTGVLNIRDKGTVVCANQLVIGAGTLTNPGTGTVNLLRGGNLTTMGIRQFNDAKATGSLYANGGELRVGGSNPAFLEGLDQAIIGPAGLTVHTNGFAVTIAQPLRAPSGLGVSSIPVVAPGSGYLAPPVIELTGGGGSGATALANVTDGSIRELIVTNPGTGYTSPPVVSVLGGGSGSGLIAGTPTLATHQGGGLTKTGLGTLTLTGTSSFCGATSVKQGELQVDGDLSRARGPVEVAPLARLSGAGQLGGDVMIAPGATLAPGLASRALRLAGALVLRGTLAISLSDPAEEILSVGGDLDLDQAILTTTAAGDLAKRVIPLVGYRTLHGKFAEISLPTGFKLDYHHGGRNVIALVPTVEADGK